MSGEEIPAPSAGPVAASMRESRWAGPVADAVVPLAGLLACALAVGAMVAVAGAPGPGPAAVLAVALWAVHRSLARTFAAVPAGRPHWPRRLFLWLLTVAIVHLLATLAGLATGGWTAPLALLAAGAVALPAAECLAGRLGAVIRARHLPAVRIAVLGAGEHGRRLLARLRELPDVRLVGIFDERRDRVPPAIDGLAVRDLGDLEQLVRAGAVDRVLIALPAGARLRIEAWARRLRRLPVSVGFVPDPGPAWYEGRPLEPFHGLAVVDLARQPLSGPGRIAKDLFDRTAAALLLAFTAPLFALVALAVRLDSPGPVFHRQKRWGFDGRPFHVLKFRTFRSEACDDGTGPKLRHAAAADPDITRIGRFLRRWSLDELPQLLNVLRGEMSLVGPRPHAVAHDEHYARLLGDYMARLRVKPGITGWAQVNGARGEIRTLADMERRVRLDLEYIENWTFLWDLEILLRTLLVGLRDPRA